MTSAPVTFEGVWKSYPRRYPGTVTLRGMLAGRVPLLARRGSQRWALTDVSFSVAPGESVGIIGQNGAGKSTLLRLASGLARPSRGVVRAPGAITSILRLGDAFDMELSGRENALSAALVAGATGAQARPLVRSALAFAELEDFADAPLRTYSEGMKLRLAFGVVAQFQPEALIVDEVLAVGDLRFQAKCLEWVDEVRAEGAAVLVASHALDQVAEQCTRAMWLEAGAVRMLGEAPAVIEAYRDAMRSETVARTPPPTAATDDLELRRNRFGSQEVTIDSVVLRGADGGVAEELEVGASLTVELALAPHDEAIDDPVVSVSIARATDGVVCVDLTTDAMGVRTGLVDAPMTVTLDVERLDLAPGDYTIDVGVHRADWRYAFDYHWQAHRLRITGAGGGAGYYRPRSSWRVKREADRDAAESAEQR